MTMQKFARNGGPAPTPVMPAKLRYDNAAMTRKPPEFA
jgi:hypothetical protein